MTTRVLITNFGPDAIEVDIVSAYKTEQAGTCGTISITNTAIQRTEKVFPNNYKELYVYDTQQLHIREVKGG